MVLGHWAMAVDSSYGPRARTSVLASLRCPAEHFYPLPKSPSISCSVFTLSDPLLSGHSLHLKNQLFSFFSVAFWMRVSRWKHTSSRGSIGGSRGNLTSQKAQPGRPMDRRKTGRDS